MPDTCIAAQLYTLRDFLKTPEDIASTLHRVAEIGYGAVQLSSVGPIDPQDLRNLCDREGLTICATHTNFDQLRDNLDAVVAEHRIYGCRYTAIPVPPVEYRNGEGYVRFAKEASEAARRAKEQGLIVGYHNHSWELEKFDGRTGLEILYTESDPEVFTAEIDTYWIQHGGGDPAAWIRSVAGRSPLVHLKDMNIRDKVQLMAEVGEGNLNWPAILAACKEAGVEWYIIEQDICERDPFESLAISLRNLRAMGLS
ncbi:MAG: Xylose isomerase protein barrel [Armatimonadetes bacterium]|nr:Xylose isomerase protein barrel [Armatimonadota bacterium]